MLLVVYESTYLHVLYSSFEKLTNEIDWKESMFRVEATDSNINIHLKEIDNYLYLLSMEGIDVTTPIS